MPVRARPRYDSGRNQWTLYHRGKRHYLCAGAANEDTAWAEARRIRGTTDGDTVPYTIPQLVRLWLQLWGSDWHRAILQPFAAFGEGIGLGLLHPDYLEEYRDHLATRMYRRRFRMRSSGQANERPAKARERLGPKRRYSPSTIRRQVSLAHRVLVWGEKRSWVGKLPALPRLPQVPLLDRSLTPQQVGAVLDHTPDRARAILTFIVLTGCRPEEACLLTRDEVRDGYCELQRGKTFARTGRPRIVYLGPAAVELISRQKPTDEAVFVSRLGKPYTPGGLRAIIQRAGARAKVKITGPYQLRHAFAMHALESLTLEEVAAALGHVPGSRVTHVYARVRADRVQKAVQRLAPVVSLDRSEPSPQDRAHASMKPRKRGRQKTPKNATRPARARSA